MMTEVKSRPTVKLDEREAILCLNAIFGGWQMVELLDEIEDTTLYRQGLKQKMKLLMPELTKFVDAIAFFFGIDSDAMNLLMEHKRQLAMKLIAVRPEWQAGLDELLAMYFEKPESVLEMVDIKIV